MSATEVPLIFLKDITFLQYEGIGAEVKKYALLFCTASGKVDMSRRKEIDIVAKFMCNVISYTLKRTVDITVVIPTPTIPQSLSRSTDATPCTHTPKEKYPVLYLLHGMGNNHATWTGYTNVEMYAEERNIAVVNISGENKAYIRTEDDDFFKFISEELPDFVCGMFPVSDRPEDTYIAGLSMGGYGTLVHGLSFPERFAAFGTFSAGTKRVRMRDLAEKTIHGSIQQPAEPGEFDPETIARQNAAQGNKFPKIYMACGREDFVYESNVQMRDLLRSLGADVTWEELPDYGHEWRFWNIEVERFLDWIPRTDSYAAQGRRKI